jgi:four helix bundle protein
VREAHNDELDDFAPREAHRLPGGSGAAGAGAWDAHRQRGFADQALRAARSACLNIAEAAGRQGAADKARVYAIARGEACETAAALDIGAAGGDCSVQSAQAAGALARKLYALLSGLIRT